MKQVNYTLGELAAEAERELETRERVYPDWIARGSLSLHTAERRIAMMREIARLLRAADRGQGDLFGGEGT
jgi:hypothetical protein